MSFEIPPDPEEELPDWLKKLRGEGRPTEPEVSRESESGGEFPEWLSQELESEALEDLAEEQDEAAEVPDWLAGIRAAEEQRRIEDEAAFEEAGDEDWLGSLRERKQEDREPPRPASIGDTRENFLRRVSQAPEEIGGEEEGPDWISGILEGEEGAPTPAEESQETEALPEMLPEVSFPQEGSQEESPDWLAGIFEEQDDSLVKVSPFVEEGPDFFESLEDTPEEEFAAEEKSPAAAQIPEVDWPWQPSAESGEGPEVPPAPPAEEIPSWLAELRQRMGEGVPTRGEGVAAEETEEEEPEPIRLPDWPTAPAQRQPEGAEEGDITPAELPSWLQAMRPVEGGEEETPEPETAPEQTVLETVGPLAGLSGILPAEAEIARYGAPAEYSFKLQVNESQRANAELFQQLIAQEGKEPGVAKRAISLPQRILRVVIAVLLFAVILVPVLTGSQSIAFPRLETIPPQVEALHTIIDSLPGGAPVLVAVDYQPGFSAEIEAAGEAVLKDLLLKDARLAFLSTQATGPGLAGRLLSALQEGEGGGQHRNLGYLPGGTNALLAFAQDPRQALPLRVEIEGQSTSVWDLPPLDGVQGLEDFALILVLTDDGEVGRAWIEQVGSMLETTPLGMVVSAQAEPLVLPYYQTDPRQVDGLLSSIAGGAYYEAASGLPGLARLRWNAFSYALGAAGIVILLGGLYNVTLKFLPALLPSPKENSG